MSRQEDAPTSHDALLAALHAAEETIAVQGRALAHSRKVFARASEAAKIGVWECDLATQAITWTDGVYDIFDIPRGEPVDRARALAAYDPASARELEAVRSAAIDARTGFSLDARIRTERGNVRWMRVTASIECEDGRAVRIFGMKQDITEEKTLAERTRFLAECDPLTGLANRALFHARLADALTSGTEGLALLLVDLDGFKAVNDTYGHHAGDLCLVAVAERLRDACGADALVARIGGDEFAILVADVDVEALAARIVEDAERPIPHGASALKLGASVGIARAADAMGREAELFTDADLALYAAKRTGRGCYRVYDPAMRRVENARIAVIGAVSDALAAGRLDLHYQPLVSLPSGAVLGSEALLRLATPEGDLLPARSLAAAFEDADLSRRIGRFVLERVLDQAARWARGGLRHGRISINLAEEEARAADFAPTLLAGLERAGLAPGAIAVEVPEDVFARADPDLVAALACLRANGVRIAIDDFGAAFASLAQLRFCPVDIVKVDAAFVGALDPGSSERIVVEALVHAASGLGVELVAKNVESRELGSRLSAIGFSAAQGHAWHPALPASDLARLLPTDTADIVRVA
ncbi:putative bifunctional diguanylate cyclase/phosphodiesterase [Salinarimonas ramus]|nr:EAL domain-containing protein [Salinarimonas ramus]